MATTTSNSNSADDAIATDLARANLARLRGDYAQADQLCQELLKQAPHNSTVATLLGDINSEQGRLDEAAQWYEMAVDAGSSAGVSEKLETIKRRIVERDSANSQADLGISPRPWLTPPVLVGGPVIIVMLLVCAYVAGTYRAPAKVVTETEQGAIVLPSSSGRTDSPNASVKADPTTPTQPIGKPNSSTTDSSANASAVRDAFDPELRAAFGNGAAGPLGRVTAAVANPRDHTVILDVSAQAGEEPRIAAAQVAQAALPAAKEATTVIVRVLGANGPVYIADCTREKFDAYTQADRPAADTSALADALLSNEWRAASDAAATGR